MMKITPKSINILPSHYCIDFLGNIVIIVWFSNDFRPISIRSHQMFTEFMYFLDFEHTYRYRIVDFYIIIEF